MMDHIVGICRFSFLGRGDWGAYIGTAHGSLAEAEAREQVATTLYDDQRMAYRFRTFETLTLASLRAQTDQDFDFIVLTSDAMPEVYLARLVALCATDPRIHLVISDAAYVSEGLRPKLAELSENGSHRLVQFRLDDDDCLCVDYIRALRRAALATRDYDAFAFSLPRALVISNYVGSGPAYYELLRPFHSAGAAVRAASPTQNVFSFGHFALVQRFPNIMEPRIHGSLHLKFDGHDSRRVSASKGSGLKPIESATFAGHVAKNFPFIGMGGITRLLAA